MTFYHATVKKAGQKEPFSVSFHADNNVAAVAELCDAAGVSSTAQLSEFEILEVLSHGHYRRAAVKEVREVKALPPPEKQEELPAALVTEPVYTPLTVKQAA